MILRNHDQNINNLTRHRLIKIDNDKMVSGLFMPEYPPDQPLIRISFLMEEPG